MTAATQQKWDLEESRDLQNEAAPERQTLISELFHALNQPLTTLRCSLELALYQQGTLEHYRECVQHALEQTGRAVHLVLSIRALVDAEDPGDGREIVQLDSKLQEVVQDFRLVAEAREVSMSLSCDSPLLLLAEPRRLHQALFNLVDSTLSGSRPGTELKIQARATAAEAALMVMLTTPEASAPGSGELSIVHEVEDTSREQFSGLGPAIARRIFEVASGSFRTIKSGNHVSFEIRLPLHREKRKSNRM